MRDIYHETTDRVFLALSHSENMMEILRMCLESFGDNERNAKKRGLLHH
ncbi:hypothetical protein OkiPb01307_17300 [Escherichia coli]|nr:hypothetical protein BvCmsNSP032_03420 [Escherichia coli]